MTRYEEPEVRFAQDSKLEGLVRDELGKVPTKSIELDPAIIPRMQEIAKDRGCGLNALVNDIVRRYLNNLSATTIYWNKGQIHTNTTGNGTYG